MAKNHIRTFRALSILARGVFIAAVSTATASSLAADAMSETGEQTRLTDPTNSAIAIDLYNGSRLLLRRDDSGNQIAAIRKTSGDPVVATHNQPSARARFAYSVLSDGSVLLSGGLDAAGAPRNTLEVFVPASLSFKAVDVKLARGRFDHVSVLLTDSRVVIIGGITESGGLVNDLEIFDPIAGVVDSGPTLMSGRRNPTVRLLATGAVLIHAGTDANGAPVLQDELFDPETGSVSAYTESLRQHHEASFDLSPPAVVAILPPHEARGFDLEERSGPANLNNGISGNSGFRVGPTAAWQWRVSDDEEESIGAARSTHPQPGIQGASGSGRVA